MASLSAATGKLLENSTLMFYQQFGQLIKKIIYKVAHVKAPSFHQIVQIVRAGLRRPGCHLSVNKKVL